MVLLGQYVGRKVLVGIVVAQEVVRSKSLSLLLQRCFYHLTICHLERFFLQEELIIVGVPLKGRTVSFCALGRNLQGCHDIAKIHVYIDSSQIFVAFWQFPVVPCFINVFDVAFPYTLVFRRGSRFPVRKGRMLFIHGRILYARAATQQNRQICILWEIDVLLLLAVDLVLSLVFPLFLSVRRRMRYEGFVLQEGGYLRTSTVH